MKTACILGSGLAAVSGIVATNEANVTIASPRWSGWCQPIRPGPGPYGLNRWYLNSKDNGPYTCKYEGGPLNNQWSMFNSYRSGGEEGVHWKYTDTGGESDCVENWQFYASDGKTLITYVHGKTTTHGGSRPWCLLPVYRTGGVENFQWGYCACN